MNGIQLSTKKFQPIIIDKWISSQNCEALKLKEHRSGPDKEFTGSTIYQTTANAELTKKCRRSYRSFSGSVCFSKWAAIGWNIIIVPESPLRYNLKKPTNRKKLNGTYAFRKIPKDKSTNCYRLAALTAWTEVNLGMKFFSMDRNWQMIFISKLYVKWLTEAQTKNSQALKFTKQPLTRRWRAFIPF